MIKEKALAYHKAGFNVLPTNGKKKPTVKGWKEYEKQHQSVELVQSWNYSSLAIIGGVGFIECFDIDTKNDLTGKVYESFVKKVQKEIPDFLHQVVIQKTPSGGYHWIYKTEKTEPSKVLAANEKNKPVLETRGFGGYFLVYPSPGYELLQGNFEKLPLIKTGIRSILFLIAKRFDMRVQRKGKKAVRTKQTSTEETLKKLLQYAFDNRIDITPGYKNWLTIGFCMAELYGESGRQLWHDLSSLNNGYEQSTANKQYSDCIAKAKGDTGKATGTLFGKLSDYGITRESLFKGAENRTDTNDQATSTLQSKEKRNAHVKRVALMQRKMIGVSGGHKSSKEATASAIDILKSIDNIEGEDVNQLINEVMLMSKKEVFENTNKAVIKHKRIISYLDAQKLKYNEITCHIEKPGGVNITDWDVNTMTIDILQSSGINVGVDTLNRYIWSDTIERYNPITTYLDQLPRKKNGELKKLIDTIDIVDVNMKPFVEKWLCSLIAAAYGNVPELVLVLLGKQGTGKTIFFQRLFPKQLEPYFSVDKLDQGKDSDILMTQKLLILDDEFYGKSKKDAEHFKSITSRHKFSIRKPYGRISEDIKRLAVLAGCSNKTNVINDNTGNRRILPVKITGRNFAAYDAIDRDLLFSELCYYYDLLGEVSYKLSAEDHKYLDSINDDFQLVNSERELLLTYVKSISKETYINATPGERLEKGYSFKPAAAIANYINTETGSKLDARKIGQELNQNGYEKDKRRIKEKQYPVIGYYVQLRVRPEFEPDSEI